MAVTITGGKYALATISSAGTSTVTVGTTPFVSTDFSIQRIVGLWNSTGTTFKGFAYVRKWTSTSSLELNTSFIDPATGLEVTQLVGDTILVSKNFAESVVAGLAVSGSTVTLTDSLILGTAGQSQSLCFYDEAKFINSSVAGTVQAIQPTGGLSVLGQLQNYAERRTGKSCSISFNGVSSYGVVMTNAAAVWCMFGGSIEGTGGSWNGGYGGTSPNIQLWMNVISGREFISPLAGGNWTNPTRQMLVNCSVIGGGIAVRWGNGSILGGSFRMPVFAASQFAMFGSDTTGTYNIGAPSGTRLTANLDGKPSGTTGVPALWRSSLAVVQTINFTNVISYDRRAISGSGANHAAATQSFYFSDTYSNLVTGTVGVILNNIGIAASIASSSNSWSPSLIHEIWNGINKTTTYGPWTYGLKAYGYNPVSGSFSKTSYQLEGTLVADNVAFGGVVNQLVDAGVTLSQSGANALTTITNLDQLYDASVAYGVASVSNAQLPSISQFPITWAGDTLNAGAYNIVLASTGVAFSISGSTITINCTNLQKGTKFIKLVTTGTVTFGTASVSNISITGNVIQSTPTNLSNVQISGTLTYNTNTATSIAISNNTSIGTVENIGTGIVTISRDNTSSITTYTDAEIVFFDSNITFAGVSSITFYPTSGDANAGTSAGATITTSPYNFKYGSVISGVTMSGTLNIRYTIGGKVTIGTLTIALGVNSFVLTDNELLSSISAKVDQTNDNLPKVNRNVIKASKLIPAGEIF